jgi:hypothetical protein
MDDLTEIHRRQVDARLRLVALVEAVLAKDVLALDALSEDLLPSDLPADLAAQIRTVLIGTAWLVQDALEAGVLTPRV